ncbi:MULTISPECIES: type IV toxin-antitoxin system AbiEi family antitoxin domain-containing protein [Photorhabdus]|uniref:S-adenosylhomocysteine hydrolase n=2 Tax=Photorhabdus TaxID=29487 RepID=A0A329X069_9GAMM|nr:MULTISPECIES: type IV toxin-antitoxin system AbiEi family antitoxin domain-containing protein [Photorhabdus]NDK99524.1 S-adenosylhomocysteine hydrolase [Photorhabdus bodei]NDL03852.1 S-adenosylhomocysteine hydrolase [Photorhabdus bodei]NDL07903.1 S-adenosylhomocysteine hydrolase [Photorhabdus bodei]RAW84435.1 S-adenosylhomocysteine hydrolase [Photorhabdus laumondii subsp. clarkei]RAX10167.1 S-adenosylhomocysteine hydrolase [Photorhabdus bodei]
MTAYEKIKQKLNRSRRYVFERKDFADIASYDQTGRALKQLTQKGLLIKIGHGLYTKARPSTISGKPIPAKPGGVDAIVSEVLKLKKIDFTFDDLTLRFMNGEITQIPASIKFKFDNRKFSTRLQIGRKVINEKDRSTEKRV